MNRRDLFGGIAASVMALGFGSGVASAQDNNSVVGAGNGGVATSSAAGGVTAISYTIGANGVVTDYSQYDVGGSQYLEYTFQSADGGTAIADASGGSYNIAVLDNSDSDEVE